MSGAKQNQGLWAGKKHGCGPVCYVRVLLWQKVKIQIFSVKIGITVLLESPVIIELQSVLQGITKYTSTSTKLASGISCRMFLSGLFSLHIKTHKTDSIEFEENRGNMKPDYQWSGSFFKWGMSNYSSREETEASKHLQTACFGGYKE